MTTLLEHVKAMRSLATMLIPQSFPQVTYKEEQEISLLKMRSITVDGYDTFVVFSQGKHKDYILETLQIYAATTPFLPFAVVSKLAQTFLGQSNLSYAEFFKNNHKIYCWTVKVNGNRSLPPDRGSVPASYDGFEFTIHAPGAVNLS